MASRVAARWSAAAFFALASTWNYLDRFVLSAAGPQIRAEFHLNNQQFGWLLSAFGFSYALASPLAGWFLDWLGLETGIVCAVGLWSLGAALCGWTRSLGQLIAARVFLGIWESAGVPAAGKLNAIYLEPKDRAIGAALTQVGLAVGGSGAPLLVGWFTGWRSPFFVCALLGLGWIPLWILVRRAVAPWQAVAPQRTAGGLVAQGPPDAAPEKRGTHPSSRDSAAITCASSFEAQGPPVAAPNSRGTRPSSRDSAAITCASSFELLADSRLLRLACANIFWMIGYVLWSNWTTIYLSETFRMTGAQANRFAWFPPVVSTFGAFAGGWLSRRAMTRGAVDVDARRFALLVSSAGCLVVALAPFCRTPFQATLVIAASYFWTTAGSVNLYTMPVDIWGGERAGTAISALVCSYGLLQTVISPAIGFLVDRFGFAPVCWLAALPPLGAWAMLNSISSADTSRTTS